MNYNRAIIVGRLTRDPELRSTPSGQQVCNFSVATTRVWNNPTTREKQEKTEFHNVVAWGRLAEIAGKYLVKGGLVLVEGRIETRNWQDQASGIKKYRTEIIAENMQLGPKSANPGGNAGGFAPTPTPSATKSQQPQEEVIPTIDIENDMPSPSNDPGDEIDVREIPF